MAPSVNHLGEVTSLKILYATDNNKIVAIAPLRKTRRTVKGKIGYNIIEPLTFGNADYTGLILAEQEKGCLSRFLFHLFAEKDWDLFYLPDLPKTSKTLELLRAFHKNLPGFAAEPGIICPYITIPDSKEKLLQSLSPSFRKRLERRMRKLEREKGTVQIKHYQELGSLEQAIETLFELHQKRWTKKGGLGAFEKPEIRKMLIQTAKLFAKKKWLELYFLTINNKPIAAQLDLAYGQKLLGNWCGFDPDYSKYSVGNLLMLKILEECAERGIIEFDFMQGAESYKFFWTNKFRQSINIRFVNRKLSSIVIGLVLRAFRTLRVSRRLFV